ncbi:hypothetical protein V8G61_04010 [Gaetbulibacter sp. M240]|uniref:hypothetical protein n=1 Tax=Gaetbulibacter sp. M240 TaxID=3126511 RepID=UPI00374E3BC7
MMKKNKLNTIKKTGFKVPEDYFNNLEEQLLSAAKLRDKNPSSGFGVPDGYFETLEERIMQQVPEAQDSKVISLFRNKYVLYTAGIAASILLLFNLSIFDHQTSWEDIDTETAENYVINENIGTYEIASLLELENIDETNFLELDIKEEQLETYLENNAEIETLLIE